MKIFSGENARSKALKIVCEKYKLFKVVVLVCSETLNNYREIVDCLNETVKSVKVLEFPKMPIQEDVISVLIQNELTDDVGIIVNFCDEVVLNVLNKMETQIKTLTFLTEPNFYVLLCKSDYFVIDDNLIYKTSNKSVADCYGRVMSLIFYIIEAVFNKVVFNTSINNDVLTEIEFVLQSLTCLPSVILKTNLGKRLLINICLKLKDLISLSQLKNSCVVTLAKNILTNTSCGGLTFGESLIISNNTLINMFSVVSGAMLLSPSVGFNSYLRINNAQKVDGGAKLSAVSESLFTCLNVSQAINNFFQIKTTFSLVFETYQNLTKRLTSVFTNLYYDKGLGLKKYLSSKTLLASVNMLPEQFNYSCFSTFIRDVGLLNRFDV